MLAVRTMSICGGSVPGLLRSRESIGASKFPRLRTCLPPLLSARCLRACASVWVLTCGVGT
eukprot:14531893-Alexandrium_andersonii.AAC.1